MGNAASLNENFNTRISKLEAMDINFSRPYFRTSSSNKCSACQTGFNILSFKRKKCVQCLENYCAECVSHYKESIYMCYRCQIFISPKLNWTELMSLKSKDLVWFLNRKNISHPHCTDKEQLADIILEQFTVGKDQMENDIHRQRLTLNMENLLSSEQEPCTSSDIAAKESVMTTIVPEISFTTIPEISSSVEGYTSCVVSSTTSIQPPPSYDEALEGGYHLCPPVKKCQRVNIEDIMSLVDIEDLPIKQLKDLLAYNKVDYKGCVERHELITRVKRLWLAYNDDREYLGQVNPEMKECVICMDQPVDCVLLECGHMLSCVRCGSKLAECPLCRQNVVRCIRVFTAH